MPRSSFIRRAPLVLAVVVVAALVGTIVMTAGCSAQAAPEAPPPPPTVTVAPVEAREIIEHTEFTGRVQAVDDVELRARISGHLQAVHFESGQLVKRGDVLFTIDSRWNEAAVRAAESAVAQARVRLENAQLEIDRAEKLLGSRAISTEEAETRRARFAEAKAFLLSTEAARDIAKLDLEFTQVKAPIDGRVSRALVTPGNWVSGEAGSNTVLTTIVSVDPVYVYMDVDESSLLDMQRRMRADELPLDEHGRVSVELGLSNDTGFPLQGVVESLDNRLNPGTGSIVVRIEVPNEDGRLVPGLFARVRVPTSKPTSTILVSERAIGTDQSQKFVLRLGPNNTVAYAAVQIGPLVDGQRVIRSGLSAGDVIIVNGLQRARPGIQVTPVTKAAAEKVSKQ
jgi:RND family efflux transporter MFP subunit